MSYSPLTVRLSAASKNLLALLASSCHETIEEYAQSVLKYHVDEAANDDAIMANLGRALLRGGSSQPDAELKKAPRPTVPAKKTESANKPDGLPRGCSRTKDGEVVASKALRAMTFSTDEAAKLLGTSAPTILRAIKENGVVPFAYVSGNQSYPRFRETEIRQVELWLETPCNKGRAPRNRLCGCGRYFSKPGLRMHRNSCSISPGDEKLSLKQR